MQNKTTKKLILFIFRLRIYFFKKITWNKNIAIVRRRKKKKKKKEEEIGKDKREFFKIAIGRNEKFY